MRRLRDANPRRATRGRSRDRRPVSRRRGRSAVFARRPLPPLSLRDRRFRVALYVAALAALRFP